MEGKEMARYAEGKDKEKIIKFRFGIHAWSKIELIGVKTASIMS
jgi:hypothetical protein